MPALCGTVAGKMRTSLHSSNVSLCFSTQQFNQLKINLRIIYPILQTLKTHLVQLDQFLINSCRPNINVIQFL